MKIKSIKFDEIPEGKKPFFVLRISGVLFVILEKYTFGLNGWDNEVLAEFLLHEVFDKKKFLERIETSFPEIKTLYVEEGTFEED